MLRIVEPQASNRLDMLRGQWGQEHANVDDLIRHLMLAVDIALDDTGLLCLANVRRAPR